MSEVYLSKSIDALLDKIDLASLGNNVGIKVHFGERGCTTYVNPEIVKKIYDRVVALGKQATLIECNVLYKGARTTATGHLEVAREHGFGEMNIDILDGENGEEFVELNGCKIGKGIEKYDSMIVLTHFKGHEFVGFGGAIKNVGMGLGSRAGKLDMHSAIKPYVNMDNCIGCGICAAHCNAYAITIEDSKAKVNNDTCEGCAMCIAVCESQAMQIPWGGRSTEDLQKRIAEYTAGVLSKFKNNLYINVLEKITADCDCVDHEQKVIMEDIGILYSKDIVAIDKASVDLANKANEQFKLISQADMYKQIELAKDMSLGSDQYNLIEV